MTEYLYVITKNVNEPNYLFEAIDYFILNNSTNLKYDNGIIDLSKHMRNILINKNHNKLNKLNEYDIINIPNLEKDWIHLNNNIFIKKESKPNEILYTLKNTEDNAQEKINKFLDIIYNEYKLYIKKSEEKASIKYFYILQTIHEMQMGGNNINYNYEYYRFELKNNKCFDNLFFPEKKVILKLLDDFLNKTNKFAICGVAQKLGFLLHGVNGSGKTSLIKAIANYTNRHIISIPLSKIKTNSQLVDIMIKFKIEMKDSTQRLIKDDTITDFSQVIFILEDIDCASNVVYSRETQENLPENDTNDGLSLDGLLNIMDGIIDTPDRILIMTTNYPEKLDSALIRPGRINKQILLTYMNKESIYDMIEYYFNIKLTKKQKKDITNNLPEQIIPAYMEQLCLENNTLKDLINQFKTHS